jgi:hypothetical protein
MLGIHTNLPRKKKQSKRGSLYIVPLVQAHGYYLHILTPLLVQINEKQICGDTPYSFP